MRKLFILSLLAVACASTGIAQEKKVMVKDETTVKKTSTVPQKVHNTFSKHKHYSGKKVTHTKKVEMKNESK